MNIKDVEKTYVERKEWFELKESQVKKTLSVLSFLRFLSFIAALFFFVYLVKGFSLIRLILVITSISLFIAFIIYYLKKTALLNHYRNLVKINSDELEAIKYNFSSFNDGENYLNREHPYSFDLDLFGQGSLFQYLNRTFTLAGRDLLANRMLKLDSDEKSILDKQKAITELAPKIEWRQNITATGNLYSVTDDDNKKIDYWIDQPVYFIKKPLYKTLVILLPIVTFLFLALAIMNLTAYFWFTSMALIQLLIASALLGRSNKEQRIVTEELRILKNYSKLIYLIENENFNSNLLSNLQKDLRTDSIQAEIAFKKLIRIIDAFDTRLNIFLGVILNATLMWDLYSMIRLEKWKLKYGRNLKNWVHVIAEFDFYCSLANYSFNNPSYIFPKISDNLIIQSEDLGHPLIPERKRVTNYFEIENAGQIAIITGANMAGKSTFLRTIGINLILAMNGVPVCAKEFKFRIMELFSGMRTADSLKENESYFYAELKRLKQIIDQLKKGKTTFLLLDEILKGTNSKDKAEGSWKFVENLIELKATGIVATHDLTLCDLEKKYPQNIKNKCFEVEINQDKILFDYKLRKGVTQNMNASILMQQMGIFSK